MFTLGKNVEMCFLNFILKLFLFSFPRSELYFRYSTCTNADRWTKANKLNIFKQM